jgi:hypothetical protein
VIPLSQTDGLFYFSLPRNQNSACADLIPGSSHATRGLIAPQMKPVKIPDIRIELRSKRIPGEREDRFSARAKG